MDSQTLMKLNESELLEIAKTMGLGRLRRGIPKHELVTMIDEGRSPRPEDVSRTEFTRQKLQNHIQPRLAIIRNQLPGCDGCCTTYPCSDGRHAICFMPNQTKAR